MPTSPVHAQVSPVNEVPKPESRFPWRIQIDMVSRYSGCEANERRVGDGHAWSKEALIMWTHLAGAKSIGRGIRVNCTSPGTTETPLLADHSNGPARKHTARVNVAGHRLRAIRSRLRSPKRTCEPTGTRSARSSSTA